MVVTGVTESRLVMGQKGGVRRRPPRFGTRREGVGFRRKEDRGMALHYLIYPVTLCAVLVIAFGALGLA